MTGRTIKTQEGRKERSLPTTEMQIEPSTEHISHDKHTFIPATSFTCLGPQVVTPSLLVETVGADQMTSHKQP